MPLTCGYSAGNSENMREKNTHSVVEMRVGSAACPALVVAFSLAGARAHVPTSIEHLFEYWFGFVPGRR